MITSKVELKWRTLRAKSGVIHLGSEERGLRTSCGVMLDMLDGPLMSDGHPDDVNCRRCQRHADMEWAQLAFKDATYEPGKGWVRQEHGQAKAVVVVPKEYPWLLPAAQQAYQEFTDQYSSPEDPEPSWKDLDESLQLSYQLNAALERVDQLEGVMKTREEIQAEVDKLEKDGPTMATVSGRVGNYYRLAALQWVLGTPNAFDKTED